MKTNQNSNPVAVLIADLHFSLANLGIASTALEAAFLRADELKVPLVIAGDLTDGKAIIRGEVMNRLIEIFGYRNSIDTRAIILVGNHDLLNEKSVENSLGFLQPYADIISHRMYYSSLNAYLLPYYNDIKELEADLSSVVKPGSLVIAHQGVQSAFMGAYSIDKTSLPKEAWSNFRVISGHYHRAQDIKCGKPRKGGVGLFTYIGSPYTITYAEAADGPKGFRVLYDNGTTELVPLQLRKHLIAEVSIKNLTKIEEINPGDLLWLKVTGPYSELEKLKRDDVIKAIGGEKLGQFKLDKISNTKEELALEDKELTGAELLDKMIDNLKETSEEKKFLKQLWRESE